MAICLFRLYPRSTDRSVPKSKRRGFNLHGATIPHGLWYQTEDDAISYAKSRCGPEGGSITIVDTHGYPVITERLDGISDIGLRPASL